MIKKMDYIYSDDNQKILIEPQQKSTRKNIIDQYIRYRKKIGITECPEQILHVLKAAHITLLSR